MQGAVADFLDGQRSSILDLFVVRARAMLKEDVTRVELVDHLPALLTEIAKAMRAGGWAPAHVMAGSPTGAQHGRQRLRVGFDLDAVVREYGILSDCIHERMSAERLTPALGEVRVLTDCLVSALAESVTEHTREHHRSAEVERRHLLGLFEQAPGFVAFFRGENLVFELANAAFLQLVGHRDVLGKPAREALPEVEGQGFFERLDSIMKTGETFVGRGMRILLQREPGAPMTEAFLDFVYQPIRGADGAITGLLAQGQDVTEIKRYEAQRQRAEAALQASEERYRTLFESIDDGFALLQMIVDPQGKTVDYRFLEANKAFEVHSGLVDALGRTARQLVPDLDDSWFELYGKVAATGEPARFENHAPAMGRWFDVYATRVGKPELLQVALVFKDITERRLAEQERERLLARESEARGEAENASRLKDEFLATVSHELRTPLNSILGWVQLLRGGTMPAEKRERALETIERNARAQAQLIEDLLDVSSVLAGKLRLAIQPIDPAVIVEGVLEILRPTADAKSIRIQAALALGATVMGDPARLQQIVWNLLSNALKFTPKGGRVHVAVRQSDSAVEITVADTGIGITEEFQAYVFDRFRQADAGSTRTQGGLGLGLSIVRQLVELHGGSVRVESEGLAMGSTFRVDLPRAVAPSSTAP